MFIGEAGSWLVVLLSYIYQGYISPRFSNGSSPLLVGGYHPVSNNDGDAVADDTIVGESYSNDPAKPSHAHDGRIQLEGRKIFLLATPACCDIAATTLMNVGLLFVTASIYQMTRGALVLFVGLFSFLFLRRKLYLYQWSALFVVVLGVAVVGLAGSLFGDNQNHDVTQQDAMAAVAHVSMQARALAKTPQAVQAIIGVLLIAAAQIFTASQFVLEEWILEHYAMDPLQVVGWEGVFGFSVTVIGSIILYLAVGRTEAGRYGYFDVKEGWHQVVTNRAVTTSSLLIMISIG
jgi:drug/metabolite transporter (DMT)-like permease